MLVCATIPIEHHTLLHLTRWNRATAPSLEALRLALAGEGCRVSEWSDPPGTIYPVHSHDFKETRWVVRGRLRIGLPESGEEFTLNPGDRLDLAPDVPHWIDVDGPTPVAYLIATRSRGNGHRRRDP